MPILFSSRCVFPPQAVAPLQLTTSNPLTAAIEGQAYSFSMGASGGTPPYTWTLLTFSQFTSSISQASLSIVGSSASETTSSTTVTPSGGAPSPPPYTYSWTWQSGGTGLTINSPSSATTSFTASSLSPGATLTGIAVCSIRDTLGRTIISPSCSVSIQRVTLVSASTSPTTESVTGVATSGTTGTSSVTASGGSGTYTYSWSWQSGGAGLTINSPSTSATSFSWSGLAQGNSFTGVAQCLVTDAFGQSPSATPTCSVQIIRVSAVTASTAPTSESSSSTATSQSTGATSITASGGSNTYTYSWSWQSGGSGISISSPTSPSTNFTASGMTEGTTYSGTAQCLVTDSFGQSPASEPTCTVSIVCQASSFTLVAGEVTEGEGAVMLIGYGSGSTSVGSLSPTTDAFGNTIQGIVWQSITSTGDVSFNFDLIANVASTYFTWLYIYSGASLIASYSSAAATFTPGSTSTWVWDPSSSPFTSGNTYTIKFSYP